MKTVKITIEGGVIQHSLIPKGVRVIVYDYDVEGVTQDLETDADGNSRVVMIWDHDPNLDQEEHDNAQQ